MKAADPQVQELLSKREYRKAEELVRSNLTAGRGAGADSHYLLGVLSYFQGRLGPSVESLKTALQLDPRHTDAAICLSVLYNDIGRYDEARDVFERANQSIALKQGGEDTEIDRKFAVKHLELADLYFRYRRYDDAIEEYTKAAMLDARTLEIRIRLAKAYAKKGLVTRAMQELQQLKVEHPGHVPALIQLGLLYYSLGNILDAELEWESARDLESDNAEAQSYLDMAKRARTAKA